MPRKGLKISLLGGFHSADPGGKLEAGVSRFPPVRIGRGGRHGISFTITQTYDKQLSDPTHYVKKSITKYTIYTLYIYTLQILQNFFVSEIRKFASHAMQMS